MNLRDRNPDDILEQALASIRQDRLEPQKEEAAAGRVWHKLSSEASPSLAGQRAPAADSLDSCAGYQSSIPDFLAGRLPEARRILVDDHTRHCIPCRKALKKARGQEKLPERHSTSSAWASRWGKWALLAAMILLTAGLAQLGVLNQFLPGPTVGQISVRSVRGTLLQVSANSSRPLAAGEEIAWKEGIRTAKDAGATFELPDGSVVELRERSEFFTSKAHDGVTLNLLRGSVIVRAAEQRTGHLYVRTNDCTVAVKGTLFSVTVGAKGSRVSVLEGEVEVEQGGKRQTLVAGQQYTSSSRLSRVPLRREVAWSQEADHYQALLQELEAMQKDLNQALFPGLRFSSRFLNLVPASTAVYVALPNLGTTLGDAGDLFQARLEQNPALSKWWRETVEGASANVSPLEAVERLRNLGSHLGDEMVLAVVANQKGQFENPLMLAEITSDPVAFRRLLEAEVAAANQEAGQEILVIVDDPAATDPQGNRLCLYLAGDLVAASPNIEVLALFQSDQAGGGSGFASTTFHEQLSDLYLNGVDWLFGVDLKGILESEIGQRERGLAQQAGLLDIRHFIVEMRDNQGLIENRAMLTFDEPRKGVVSWLAEPAPLGGLDFLSADTSFATAFAIKDPGTVAAEMFEMFSSGDEGFRRGLEEAQRQIGINLTSDLAATLGGEFVVAVDGPILPFPSWKVVLEVYDQARLQSTLETLVSMLNLQLATQGKRPIEFSQETVNGRLFHSLASPDYPIVQIHYTYVDGYLLAGPNSALLLHALQLRETGYTLPRSQEFVELLPQDGQIGFSAVVYQNLKSALGPLAGLVQATNLPPEQKRYLEKMADGMSASLMVAYAEEQRILFASTGHFGLNPSQLMGMGAFQLPGMGGSKGGLGALLEQLGNIK
ncbi:MAG: FecR family protein [Acidobacteriota bacterium]